MGALRKVFFWTHLSLGLVAGLIIAWLALTGFVLSSQDAVLGWAERGASQVSVPADAKRLPLDTLMVAGQALTPGAKAVGFMVWAEPSKAVRIQLEKGPAAWVDPYSGVLLGDAVGPWRHFYETVEGLHRNFGFEGKAKDRARAVKEACNMGFALLLLSALYLWLPLGTRGWYFRPKGGLKGQARDFNWHNSLGLWAWPLAFTMSLTGLVMSYAWAEGLLYKSVGETAPARPPRPGAMAAGTRSGPPASVPKGQAPQPRLHRGPFGRMGQRASGNKVEPGKDPAPAMPVLGRPWQRYLDQAAAQQPGWISLSARGLKPGASSLDLNVQTADLPMPRGRGMLKLDLKDASVKSWEPFDGLSRGRRLRQWARWSHTGQAFGGLGSLLAALGCILILVLVWTGYAMSWRRFFGNGKK